MWLRLRQICLVAHDLAEALEDIQSVPGLAVCFVDSHVGKYGLVCCTASPWHFRAPQAAQTKAPDPDGLARRWSAIAEIPLVAGPGGAPEIPLGNARLRFVPPTDGRGEGLGGIDLRAVDAQAALAAARTRGCPLEGRGVTLCGTRFRLLANSATLPGRVPPGGETPIR